MLATELLFVSGQSAYSLAVGRVRAVARRLGRRYSPRPGFEGLLTRTAATLAAHALLLTVLPDQV